MKRPAGLIVIIVSALIAAFSLFFISTASAVSCTPNFFWDRSKAYGITNDQKTAQITVDNQYQFPGWRPINGGNIVCGVIRTNLGTYTVFNGDYGRIFQGSEFVQTVAVQVSGGSTQGQTSAPSIRPTSSPTPAAPAPLLPPPICNNTSPSADPSPVTSDTSTATIGPSSQSSDTPTVGLISLSADVSQIIATGHATVYGYVADTSGCAMPSTSVALMYQPYAGAEYVLQVLSTDAAGRFNRIVAPPKQARFWASAEGVESVEFVLNVARRLTISSPRGNTRVRNPVTFSGSLSPATPGVYVGFSRWQSDRWVYLGHAQTNTLGRWATHIRIPRGGITLRLYAPSYAGNAKGEAIIRVVVIS